MFRAVVTSVAGKMALGANGLLDGNIQKKAIKVREHRPMGEPINDQTRRTPIFRPIFEIGQGATFGPEQSDCK